MRQSEPRALFSELDLTNFLEERARNGIKESERPLQSTVAPRDLDALAQTLFDAVSFAPLTIKVDDTAVHSEDAMVDVSNDFTRAVMNRGRPALVKGVRVTYCVPFEGDAALLRWRPESYTTRVPRAVVSKHEILFRYEAADNAIANTKTDFQSELADLMQWVGFVNAQVERFNAALPSRFRAALQKRQEQLHDREQKVAALGFKVRSDPPATP
jgi:hypothetical protein